MPYIRLRDHQKMFVREIGASNSLKKPTIILLHGFGMQSIHWLPFIIPLARKFHFLIPDLRGFGHSHSCIFNQHCVITNYADDLDDMINHFQLKSFKLVGISMGAFVALKYQGVYGDHLVDRYLHIDQSPKCINNKNWQWGIFGADNTKRLESAAKLVSELSPYMAKQSSYEQLPKNLRMQLWHDLGDFFSNALSKPTHQNLAKKVCANEKIIRRLMPVKNWPAYIHCLKAYIEQDYDMQTIIEEMKTPISLIVGLKSEMYPCGGQLRIADYNKNCEVIPFVKSGHTPLIDQPFRFTKELKRFCAQ